MKLKFNLKNQLAIESINRFCLIAAILSGLCLAIYLILGIYFLAVTMLFMTSTFSSILYLNKWQYAYLARVMIIVITNIGVLAFSIFLGFKSGVFFYLFNAAHLTLLLFSYKQKLTICLCMASYAITFLLAYLFGQNRLIESAVLTPNVFNLICILNFLCSIIFEFGLIVTLSKSNDNNIDLLLQSNDTLEKNEALLQAEIVEKSKLNENLRKTLKEKEILLSEIHHRVKNNLAVISGLIELQNFYVKDEIASAILKESRNRIKSIAVLHEKFYESKNLESIEIRSYVDELIYFIKLSFSNQHKDIKIHTQIDNIELSMANALPFSLLINELITNSYKHAFKNKTNGNIYIAFIKNQNKMILNFRDDGCGFDLSAVNKESSLGMNLIEAFSNQLKAQTTCESKKDQGTEFKLQFEQELINVKEPA